VLCAMIKKTELNVEKLWKSVEKYYENLEVGINVNNVQPGGGKTFGFVQHVNKNLSRKIIFFSSNHDHLYRLEKKLKPEVFIHWKGFSKTCARYPKEKNKEKWTLDEKLIYEIYNKFPTGVRFLCSTCNQSDNCKYKKQFLIKKNIILAPLEYIFRHDILEKFDEIWADESIRKLTTYNWDFSEKKFKNFIKALNEIPRWGKQTILNEYYVLFKKINKEMIRNTSIIFQKVKDELLNFNDKSFLGNDWVNKGFLRNKEYITHIEKLRIVPLLLRNGKIT